MNEHAKITERCRGCGHISGDICMVYLDPAAKFRGNYTCPMFTGDRGKVQTPQKKQRIGAPKHAKLSKA